MTKLSFVGSKLHLCPGVFSAILFKYMFWDGSKLFVCSSIHTQSNTEPKDARDEAASITNNV